MTKQLQNENGKKYASFNNSNKASELSSHIEIFSAVWCKSSSPNTDNLAEPLGKGKEKAKEAAAKVDEELPVREKYSAVLDINLVIEVIQARDWQKSSSQEKNDG